jgi:hypothetical protein
MKRIPTKPLRAKRKSAKQRTLHSQKKSQTNSKMSSMIKKAALADWND